MKKINTIPIEQFLDKARIALASNQKNITFDQREIRALYDTLAVVMTRIVYMHEQLTSAPDEEPININMDGGSFS